METEEKLYYYHNDINGAPLRLTDDQGKIVWNVHYNTFGKIDRVGPRIREVHNPIRMQGQYEDEETGLYYNRYRYFDPHICAYISQDPLGLLAGENVYCYPVNSFAYTDPLGLKCPETSANKENASVPYKGVKEASEYLKSQNVPRTFRKQIIESFDIKTIKMDTAGNSTFGIRFYDGINAQPKGRYLFETFNPLTNRQNLALPPEWNRMTGFKQFQVKPGTIIIKGNAAPQTNFGAQYVGGETQWYINNLNNLIP